MKNLMCFVLGLVVAGGAFFLGNEETHQYTVKNKEAEIVNIENNEQESGVNGFFRSPEGLSTSDERYLWIDGEEEISGGIIKVHYKDENIFDLNVESQIFLHFPANTYSTLYLSGNGESHVFLLTEDMYQNPEWVQKNIESLADNPNSLEDEIIAEFYRVSGEEKWMNSLMILGDRGNVGTIFNFPSNLPSHVSILVSIFPDYVNEGEMEDIFWELSNKETILVNEGGMAMEYIKDSDHLPNFKGADPYGDIVPRDDGLTGF